MVFRIAVLVVLAFGVLAVRGLPVASEERVAAVTAAPLPAAPSTGHALSDFAVRVQWTNPAGTTQNQLQVAPANNDGPGINLIVDAIDSYSIQPPPFWYGLLPDTTYTWRVRATDATTSVDESSAQWGPWSDDTTFRTPRVSAESIRLVSPPNASVVSSSRVLLQWSDANSRTFYYEVQLSRDPTFTTDLNSATAAVYWELRHGGVTVPRNSYELSVNVGLEQHTNYYWRVRPRVQGDGTPVEWSASSAFFLSTARPLRRTCRAGSWAVGLSSWSGSALLRAPLFR